MYEFAPAITRPLDFLYRPAARLVRERLGLMPAHVSWASFVASAAAAVVIADRQLVPGLGIMALGQFFDGLDGAVARFYGLASEKGRRLDTALDRASESVIFVAFALGGFVSWRLAALAIVAVMLLTTICHRTKLDPGVKRFALYFGLWSPYATIFSIIFAVNLTGFVAGLLILDCRFQIQMDTVGGDLDTVASRTVAFHRDTAEPAGALLTPDETTVQSA
ncbi:MAG: CDP-alcohol phosphatidyltransferase family protein [Gemmatimonadetes bacterium]|nr:CDP-alcohol phosphatidyltransferase family protein [Gemmatimonadota bacterium]